MKLISYITLNRHYKYVGTSRIQVVTKTSMAIFTYRTTKGVTTSSFEARVETTRLGKKSSSTLLCPFTMRPSEGAGDSQSDFFIVSFISRNDEILTFACKVKSSDQLDPWDRPHVIEPTKLKQEIVKAVLAAKRS